MAHLESPERLRDRDHSEMDGAFEVFFRAAGRRRRAIRMEDGIGWRPAADVYETADHFVVQVDLAGLDLGRIELMVDDEYLSLRGTRDHLAPEGRKVFHKMEIPVGPFERHIRLPSTVDPRSAVAHFERGFLLVRFDLGDGRCEQRRSIDIDG